MAIQDFCCNALIGRPSSRYFPLAHTFAEYRRARIFNGHNWFGLGGVANVYPVLNNFENILGVMDGVKNLDLLIAVRSSFVLIKLNYFLRQSPWN